MGADGGFHIAKVKDPKMARLILEGLRVGLLGSHTGVTKLWGQDVYIGCAGTNFYGPELGELRSLVAWLMTPDCTIVNPDDPITTEVVAKAFGSFSETTNFQRILEEGLMKKWNEAGLNTVREFYKALLGCLDWPSLSFFETWT